MSATATAYRASQEAVARRTAAATAALWSQMDPADFDGSWEDIQDRMFVAVAAGQSTAAGQSDDYLDAILAEQGIRRQPEGRVNASALAGIAPDGRPLETGLRSPLVQAKTDAMQGLSGVDALTRSGHRMMRLTASFVADAGRQGISAGMGASPQITKYARVVQAGACARCSILAGQTYRTEEPFLRHPFCMCAHIPLGAGAPEGYVSDPEEHFNALSREEQDRIYTKPGAETIRMGGDMNQVVNARRGMKTVTAYGRKIQTTTVGTSVRATGGRAMQQTGTVLSRQSGSRYRVAQSPRLMPEQILRDAKDRADAIRLLKRFGYLHGGF